ncbi:retinoic acid receptor responder protein 2-like isoform X2 [Pleurodeles waltl]|uniref:retinoic acid receptor responder protein 2-like isoform X2 n=1 Tax=Pleurodeles waltl TaxID=8319 RepID=UPI00370990E0
MKKLLLALWLTTLAITAKSDPLGLSELERKTLDTVVEEFNWKPGQKYAHKPVAVQSREEKVVSEGAIVTLEFTIKPTSCKKEGFRPEKCSYRRFGRIQSCFACFKYEDANSQPLGQFWDCVPTRTPSLERRQQQQQKCEGVKRETTEHMIGQFSFLKSAPQE